MRAAWANKIFNLFFFAALLIAGMSDPGRAGASPEMAAKKMNGHFMTMDTDKDGKLSGTEFREALPNMRDTAFNAFDVDGDEFITLEEWTGGMSVHMGAMPPKEAMTGPDQAVPVKRDGGGADGGKGPGLRLPPKADP